MLCGDQDCGNLAISRSALTVSCQALEATLGARMEEGGAQVRALQEDTRGRMAAM